MTSATPLSGLHDQAVDLMRQWATGGTDRTAILRLLAAVTVDARSHFHDTAGNPDWPGRTYEWRQYAHEVYEDAALSDEDERTLQGALRYHVGNAIRSRASDAELQRAGLVKASPKERIAADRAALVAEAEAAGRRTRSATVTDLLAALERRLAVADASEVAKAREALQRILKSLPKKSSLRS